MKNTISIHGLNDSIAFCEAQGLSKCFKAYADYCAGEFIIDGGIGFNANSGFIYIALENCVCICSMMGGAVQYLVTNPEDGEEYFFDTYKEALEQCDKINN